MASILGGKYRDVLIVMGICCSTWVQINAGTSQQDELVPEGFEKHRSVASSNKMVSRPDVKKR